MFAFPYSFRGRPLGAATGTLKALQEAFSIAGFLSL